MFTDIMATIDAELAIKVLKTYVKEFKSLSAAKNASGHLSMLLLESNAAWTENNKAYRQLLMVKN